MSVLVRTVGGQRRVRTQRKILRGYAASRRAYDARRRRTPLDHLGKSFKRIVQADPCAFCGRRPPVDADHIVALAEGGENTWENLAGVCHGCNASKKNRSVLSVMLDAR